MWRPVGQVAAAAHSLQRWQTADNGTRCNGTQGDYKLPVRGYTARREWTDGRNINVMFCALSTGIAWRRELVHLLVYEVPISVTEMCAGSVNWNVCWQCALKGVLAVYTELCAGSVHWNVCLQCTLKCVLAVYNEMCAGSVQSKQDSTRLLDRQYDPSIRRTPFAPTRSLVTVLTELSKLLNNTSVSTFKDVRSQTISSFRQQWWRHYQ